jgi:L-iditol 2-dehydrogenase
MKVARSVALCDVRLEEAPEPEAGADGVVCRVLACGVCGSDVSDAYVAAKLPAVLGHEVVGEVVALGPAVHGPAIGDRVVIHHHAPCGECPVCAAGHETLCPRFRSTALEPGGFAERVRVSAELVGELLPLDGLDPVVATFAEPLGCALRALDRTALAAGERLLVAGAGCAGLLVTAAARDRGVDALYVSEPRPERRARAVALGARAHGGEQVDVAVVCTGAPAAAARAAEALAPGGRLLLYATPPAAGTPLPVDWSLQFRRELTVLTSWSAGPADMRAAVALLAGGAVDPRPWVTHRLGLADTGRALELARSGEALKAVVLP